MNFISLDLEMNQPSGRIIQIGAVVCNPLSGDILEEFNRYILLPAGEQLSEFITNLTGITDATLLQAVPLTKAYEDLVQLHTRHNCYRNPITWGGGDSAVLRTQLGLDDEKFLFGRRWWDMKTVFQMYCLKHDIKLQAGLAKALTRVGLQFNGRKHDGLADAKNTARMAHFLLRAMS
mgnify:CR=1 FL=1